MKVFQRCCEDGHNFGFCRLCTCRLSACRLSLIPLFLLSNFVENCRSLSADIVSILSGDSAQTVYSLNNIAVEIIGQIRYQLQPDSVAGIYGFTVCMVNARIKIAICAVFFNFISGYIQERSYYMEASLALPLVGNPRKSVCAGASQYSEKYGFALVVGVLSHSHRDF